MAPNFMQYAPTIDHFASKAAKILLLRWPWTWPFKMPWSLSVAMTRNSFEDAANQHVAVDTTLAPLKAPWDVLTTTSAPCLWCSRELVVVTRREAAVHCGRGILVNPAASQCRLCRGESTGKLDDSRAIGFGVLIDQTNSMETSFMTGSY